MPDRRVHRGPHPQDAKLFSPAQLPVLQQATRDLSWLFSHGYSIDASLKLVGDRYQLNARQRLAVARCAAGGYRDMASMHGTYRKVAETLPAIELIGTSLAKLGNTEARWLLDKPVSNSGRLATMLREAAQNHGWQWTVELVNDPDAVMIAAPEGVVNVTADSVILDRSLCWFSLTRHIIDQHIGDAWIIRLN